VTLTAPAVHEGAFFAGWRDVRDPQALGLYESRTITIIVVEDIQAMEAIYPVPWSLLKRLTVGTSAPEGARALGWAMGDRFSVAGCAKPITAN